MEALIVSDRPIPKRVGKIIRYGVLYRMEPGQSVELVDFNYSALRSTITYLKNRYGKTFATRRQQGGTIIVWRLS